MKGFIKCCFYVLLIEKLNLYQSAAQSVLNTTVEPLPYMKRIDDIAKNLLKAYSKVDRPVKNLSSVTTVEIYTALKHMEEVVSDNYF